MAGNGFGTLFRFTTWGESHGPAIGVVVDGMAESAFRVAATSAFIASISGSGVVQPGSPVSAIRPRLAISG